jgi:magnesium-transporting ATPase (P-type)
MVKMNKRAGGFINWGITISAVLIFAVIIAPRFAAEIYTNKWFWYTFLFLFFIYMIRKK